MDIDKITHAGGKILSLTVIRDLHMTPGFVRIKKHEQIGCAIAAIFIIITLGLAGFCRDRLAHLADQLRRTFIEANHRMFRIGCFGVEIEHILHSCDVGAVHLRNAPHIALPRFQIVLGQMPAHRLV